MAQSYRTRRRAKGRIPWDLVPLGLLCLGLVIVLCQRALDVLRRAAAETPWLLLVIVAGICLVAVGGLVLRFGLPHRRAHVGREPRVSLARVRTVEGLRTLSPTAFELAVAELLRALGYRRVTHTGGSGDLCADLTCRTRGGHLVVVQCKRYGETKRVGSAEIQQFLGMMTIHHRAQRGLYVTTSGYTRQALALAQQHSTVLDLIDGARLVSLLHAAG